jgi:asparagine synthase (glutamine-hydrolysing)
VIARQVPPGIVERRKHGFEAPVGEWLRGPLAPLADSLLADGRLRGRGLFNDREVTRLWTEHRTGRADHRHRLWQLIMLELWFRQFVDRAPAERAHLAEAI